MFRIVWVLAAGLLIASFPTLADGLTVAWPDIEQGACMLIMGPDGTGALIDAGTLYARSPDENVVSWLREFTEAHPGFRLRYVFATHYHQDHVCWIDDIVAAGLLAPDGVVYDRGGSYSTDPFATYKSAVSPYRQTISPGQVFDLGGGATLQCLIAAGQVYGDGSISTSDENNLSLGLLLSYEDFQLWVGGDLEKEVETLAKNVIGDVDVYVVHHHGSGTSSTLSFLNAVKPEVAVCQVGKNTYGHPSIVTTAFILKARDTDGDPDNGTPMLILQNRGSYFAQYPKVYIADPDDEGPQPGTVELHTDGTTYTITAPGFPGPISLSTDGVGVTESPTTAETPAPPTPPTPPAPPRQCTVSVILEAVQLIYNNSVGNDWSLGLSVNDRRVGFSRYRLPQTVWTGTFNGSTTLTVTAIAVEDDKYPDVGRAAATFTVGCPPSPTQTATLEVLVREDRGRYAGNTALWRFQIRVEVSQ